MMTMIHRHIKESENLSLAAIDDIIDRGGVDDWRGLKKRADGDAGCVAKILKVCAVKISDPYAQRYHLWDYYAKHVIA